VLAVHTGTVRLLFAMARDGQLPFSRRLARVAPRSRMPQAPVLVSGGLAVALLLVNVNFKQVVAAMVSVSIVWANLAYLLVTVPLLVRRCAGWPGTGGSGVAGLFALGRWGIAVNVIAVAWGMLTVVNMAWPREAVYGEETWYQQYAAPLYTGVLLLVGVVYYETVKIRGAGGSPAPRRDDDDRKNDA
jgi:amino acid transporter